MGSTPLTKLLCLLCLAWGLWAHEKTICLNMIVKNESHVIERCLASVRDLIDTWVIVDTGSTDGTQEIIRQFLKDKPGELHERSWRNFEHNRNEALQLAKGKGDFVLFIDADEVFDPAAQFTRPLLDKDYYLCTFQLPDRVNFTRIFLVKNELDWKWEGVLHEQVHSPRATTSDLLAHAKTLVNKDGARSKDPKTFYKDALVLEEALKKEPNNARYVFYLAQSYVNAGEDELALRNFEKRVTMAGWDQEVYWSLYFIGRLQEALNKPADTVIQSYTKAYLFRPSRAEPLYRLAKYYREKQENPLLGTIVLSYALQIPLPVDNMFVEQWIYDFGLEQEYANCCFGIGDLESAQNTCQKLLLKPNVPPEIKELVAGNLDCVRKILHPEK